MRTVGELEVWYVESGTYGQGRTWAIPHGYYWRNVAQDAEPRGPFATEREALDDARWMRAREES